MTGDRYCWDCTFVRSLAPEGNDFAGLCDRADNIAVPCAGCGEVVWVDHRGRRVQGTGTPVDEVDLRAPVPVPRVDEQPRVG